MASCRVLVGVIAVAMSVTAPPVSAGPGIGSIASDNVEHVAFIPFEVGTATGARVVGKHLFVTSWKNLAIYDVSDPLNPELLSTTPIGFQFENEDVPVSPDGNYLLFSESLPRDALHVWDLQSRTQPREVGTLPGAGDHTSSCIRGCRYAWGSEGSVSDLRRKDAPKSMGNWREAGDLAGAHDVTEVADGLVLTSSQPIQFLDARRSVVNPRLLATGRNADRRFVHSILWPRKGRDRFFLAGGETNANTRCNDSSAKFMVWDTRNWKTTGSFRMVAEYKYKNGVVVEGNPPVNGLGCSPHWFSEHPSWKDGGLVAVASYEHGTRFLTVSPRGELKEVGWFLPLPGSQSAVYWLGKDLLYAIDYARGIDVLRWKGPLK